MATAIRPPDHNAQTTDMDREFATFEAAERARLGLSGERPQWLDLNPNRFTLAERDNTTILVSGLTHAHDLFIRAAISSCGYSVQVLDCPDSARSSGTGASAIRLISQLETSSSTSHTSVT